MSFYRVRVGYQLSSILFLSQSGMIIPAINETPWHLFGPKARKHLVIIMANSQEALYFTCGKLIKIDLRLFVMVSGKEACTLIFLI